MNPRSVPCGPVERGFVSVSLALETHVPTAGGVGLCQSYLPRLAELLHLSRLNSIRVLRVLATAGFSLSFARELATLVHWAPDHGFVCVYVCVCACVKPCLVEIAFTPNSCPIVCRSCFNSMRRRWGFSDQNVPTCFICDSLSLHSFLCFPSRACAVLLRCFSVKGKGLMQSRANAQHGVITLNYALTSLLLSARVSPSP